MGDERTFAGNYLVAFIDLLGEQDNINKIEDISRIKEDGPQKEHFSHFVKSIKFLHDTIDGFIASQDEASSKSSVYEELDILRTGTIKFQRFSDAIVLFTPLYTCEEMNRSIIRDVNSIIIASGALCLFGLYNQTPVRIGVALNWGVELYDGELYGKALMEAYLAESKTAQYPRAIVTQSVVDFLSKIAMSEAESNNQLGNLEVKLAEKALSTLTEDFDGNTIVNYLDADFSPSMMEQTPDIYREAFLFVTDELERHKSNRDSKLTDRYSLLHKYFSQHLEIQKVN